MAKIIHSMIRVLDEARSLAFYDAALGLTVAERCPFDGFTLIYLRNPENDMELELTINDGRTQPYELGDGYGHLAVAVPDLEGEHARMTGLGFEVTALKTFSRDGAVFARFFFLKDPDGYKIEVLQSHGRFR